MTSLYSLTFCLLPITCFGASWLNWRTVLMELIFGGRLRWQARTWTRFCLQTLHQLQQALDGLCQVMVWYQLAGLQGHAAKSQGLAHKHKRKQNTAAAASVRVSGGRVKLTYIIILLKTELQPGQINLSRFFPSHELIGRAITLTSSRVTERK